MVPGTINQNRAGAWPAVQAPVAYKGHYKGKLDRTTAKQNYCSSRAQAVVIIDKN